MHPLNINGAHLSCFKPQVGPDTGVSCVFLHGTSPQLRARAMEARMKLTRRNCAHTRRAVVNVRRERVISNFDTKTIRVSSSPATLSYLTRCLGSLYGDAGGRVRNEEKGKRGAEGERKLQKDRYARGSEDEDGRPGQG